MLLSPFVCYRVILYAIWAIRSLYHYGYREIVSIYGLVVTPGVVVAYNVFPSVLHSYPRSIGV